MLQSFGNIPIKRKVTLVIMIASMVTLLLASASLFVVQWLRARHTIKHDLQVQAEIIGANSTAALTFEDQRAAAETLMALKAKPQILGAALYLPDGTRLALYGEAAFSPSKLLTPVPEGLRAEGPHLLLFQPVRLDHRRVGTLHLRFDFRAMEMEIITPFLVIMGAIVLAAFFPAIALSSAFQQVISAPILRLTSSARSVAENKDYSVRADPSGQDEIGTLTQAFNQMLARIQEQDAALRAAGERHRHQHETLTSLTRGEALYADDVETTLRRLCEAGAKTLDVERSGVWRWNEGRTALRCVELYERSPHRHSAGLEIAAADYPAFFEAISGTEVIAADHALTDPRTCEFRERFLLPLGVTSLLDTPINLNGQRIGVLCHAQVGPARSWQPDEQMFVIAMANLVSLAFGHSERKQTQAELDEAHRRLVESSRMAGMAEVATGVLHNVGNVLNSVNVSANLVIDRLRESRIASLPKLAGLLEANAADLGRFLASDPRGRQVPGYISSLAKNLGEEQAAALGELEGLRKHIDHIKQIVAMQQNYAKVSGVIETVPPAQLVEDALQLNAGALARHGVKVFREFAEAPPIAVEKHKVLQILVNLIRNAKYAMDEARSDDKRLVLRITAPAHERIRIEVIDNGVGIPPANLTRIFQHGFTTRKDGHGFGLHSGALAARELGGRLTGHSNGPGTGATFTLELPSACPKVTTMPAATRPLDAATRKAA